MPADVAATPPCRERRGLMLVISSPSGAGKTALSRRLMQEHPEITLSVSATTRDPRPGEVDGREYHFVTPERFETMVRDKAFLEYAIVHGNRYGTPRDEVMRALEAGQDVLFDIDWQGATSLHASAPADVVRVFILPPSMAELSRRLHGRAQDSEEVIARRLEGAKLEIRMWGEYDYAILNDDFDQAYERLELIYRAERLKRTRNPWLVPFVQRLMEEAPPKD